MPHKIANAIDCLKTHHHSKRAIIPIPFNSAGSETVDWNDAGQTKVSQRKLKSASDGELIRCQRWQGGKRWRSCTIRQL